MMERLIDYMDYPRELPVHLYERFEHDLARTAVHEAGHAVVLEVCTKRPGRHGGVRDLRIKWRPEALADPSTYRLVTGQCEPKKRAALSESEWRYFGLAGTVAEAILIGIDSAGELAARLLDDDHSDGLWIGQSDGVHADLDCTPWTQAHLAETWDFLTRHWIQVLAVARMMISNFFRESDRGSFG